MGEKVFDLFPEQVAIADAELGYSVVNLCFHDRLNQLDLTPFSQTALFVVNALNYLNHLGETGRLPRFVAGHGVGEYNALFAAGVFDFQTGIRLVMERAKLVTRASGGGMAVVIGLTPDQIREALAAAGLTSIDIAILNSRRQTVISGPEQDLELSRIILEQAGAQRFELLPVSRAFHSRYMVEAEQHFGAFLKSCLFTEPRIPVISNVTARLHDSPRIKQMLARQITQPIRWTESVQWLLGQPSAEFLEMGPGNVLTTLLDQIKTETEGLPAGR